MHHASGLGMPLQKICLFAKSILFFSYDICKSDSILFHIHDSNRTLFFFQSLTIIHIPQKICSGKHHPSWCRILSINHTTVWDPPPSNPKRTPRKGHPVTASADTFASPTLAGSLCERSASCMSFIAWDW